MTDLSTYNQESLLDKLTKWTDKSHPSGCWIWSGSKCPNGYGIIQIYRKPPVRAHRVSFHLHKGQLQEGMFICHHCDNPSCVNPEHLFQGSTQDNARDMVQKGRQSKGEQSPLAKLTDQQVIEIRKRWANRLTQTSLAKELGITVSDLNVVIYSKGWKHVPPLKSFKP